MRTSTNQVINNRLINGYDYENQAWVINGKYTKCGHPKNMNCECYGKQHEGEKTTAICKYCGTSIPSDYCQECDFTANEMGIDLYN